MKITADTNVLLRAVLDDDLAQQQAAIEALERADLVAVSLQSLCEFAWVLARSYQTARADIASALRAVIAMRNVVVNRPAAEAGLAMLEAGGDFADGVIAYEGRWLGGETFVSFDKQAVRRLAAQGLPAQVLG
ncbi:MAG: type II toxin-antitoxin system VapC family toxin [Pseudomonadota bacterium]